MNVITINARRVAGLLVAGAAGMVASWTMLAGFPLPSASAQQCPDVEVVFARGTVEPPGVGGTGQAFVDALRSQLGGKSVGVYAVDYPASSDFAGGVEFARTVVDGVRDAGSHVQATAANCPDTRIVLGGFSQGAVVAGYVTAAEIPAEVPAEYRSYIPQPMPPEVAEHVAAVTLLGMPSEQFMRKYGAPPVVIGPLYAAKTIKVCAPGDSICDGAADPAPNITHAMYAVNGMVSEAAAFALSRLS